MNCGNCRAPITYQDKHCGQCGREIDWNSFSSPGFPLNQAQEYRDAKAEKQFIGYSSPPHFQQQTNENHSIASANVLPNKVPILFDTWKTSVGLSILGLMFASGAGSAFGNALGGLLVKIVVEPSVYEIAMAACFFSILFLLPIIYALVIYPSYFEEKPILKSRHAISFWNCFFGGLIFGLLWNGSLTKRDKGASQYVFSLMSVFVLVLSIFSISSELSKMQSDWAKFSYSNFDVALPEKPSIEEELSEIEGFSFPYTLYEAESYTGYFAVQVISYPEEVIEAYSDDFFDSFQRGYLRGYKRSLEDEVQNSSLNLVQGNIISSYPAGKSISATYEAKISGETCFFSVLIVEHDMKAYVLSAADINQSSFDLLVSSFEFTD